MRYGMGQASAPVADWVSVERFARSRAGSAGGLTAMFESRDARLRRWAGHTSALQSLMGTVAVRPMAMRWLALPASRHRDGLLEIAEFARVRGARPVVASSRPASAPAHGRVQAPATVAARPPSAPAPGRAQAVQPVSGRQTTEQLLAAVRAELAKSAAARHRGMAEILSMVDPAVADPFALRSLLVRLLPRVQDSEVREILAVLVVRLQQADSARGTRPAGSPPSSEPARAISAPGVGNYYA